MLLYKEWVYRWNCVDEDGLSLLTCPGYEGNRKKAVPDREPTQEYEEKLQSLFDRWAAWNRSGSPDAKVTDGIYLNRLRQGILRMQKEIERCIPEEQYPECYYAMVPPMKAEDYMVSPDKLKNRQGRILRNSKKMQILSGYRSI